MTINRPYGLPKTVAAALSECGSLIGRQFTEPAVAALIQLHASGGLGSDLAMRPALVAGLR